EVPQQVLDLGPYDAVLASELIEHVADPVGLLDACGRLAPRVLLTTPDGAYDGPQEHNNGHVRAWSQREFTRLVMNRGRIVEMHTTKEPFEGGQKNLVCEYATNQSLPQKAAVFFCPPVPIPWTPDSIRDTGVGGSETAVIRVAEELA